MILITLSDYIDTLQSLGLTQFDFDTYLFETIGGYLSGLGYDEVYNAISHNADELDFSYTQIHSAGKYVSPALARLLTISKDGTYALRYTAGITEEHIKHMCYTVAMKYGNKWNRLYQALTADYNPIHNYDMTESGSDSGESSETPDLTTTDTQTDSSTTTPNLTDTVSSKTGYETSVRTTSNDTNRVAGFNSSELQPSDAGTGNTTRQGSADSNYEQTTGTDSQTGTLKEEGSRSNTHTEKGMTHRGETSSHSLTRSGNIGVTTTQKMISEELELRSNVLYDIIMEDMDKEICLAVYY